MKHRYFLEIAYNGSEYHGWQKQKNALTVQEVLEEALSTQLGEEIRTQGCGRTDTGVHARQFFLHFDSGEFLGGQFAWKLDRFLPWSIAVKGIYKVPLNSHARFKAISRSYEYQISQEKDPFLRSLATYYYEEVDLDKLNCASELLKAYTNYQAFSKTGRDYKTFDCEVTESYWEQKGSLLIFHIKANRFLRSMVRLLASTLLDVGNGKMSVEEFRGIIESRDRMKAAAAAPPDGLYLTLVEYPRQYLNTDKKKWK